MEKLPKDNHGEAIPKKPSIDARPTRACMEISEKEKEMVKKVQENDEKETGRIRNVLKRLFSRKIAPTKSTSAASGEFIQREPSIDPRPTRTHMKSSEKEDGTINKVKYGIPKIKEKKEREISFELNSQEISFNSPAHPERTEDAWVNDPKNRIFAVFDGVGGAMGGAKASGIAKDVVHSYLLSGLGKLNSMEDATRLMYEALERANLAILNFQEKNRGFEGMATTATVSFIFDGQLVTGQLGDSRAYLFRKGSLKQLTKDDSLIPEEILKKFNNIERPHEELTEKELVYWNGRNVIEKYLGKLGMKPKITIQEVQKGDKILLTSDGIHDNLTDNAISNHLRKSEFKTIAQEAYQRAKEDHINYDPSKRYKRDDGSIILVEIN